MTVSVLCLKMEEQTGESLGQEVQQDRDGESGQGEPAQGDQQPSHISHVKRDMSYVKCLC